MNDECVVTVFMNIEQVEQAVHMLKRGGFPIAQISVITKGLEKQTQQIDELAMGSDDSIRDAAVGAGLGGLAGMLAGIGMSTAIDMGIVFVLGPIVAITGLVVGGFLGAMNGWGVHQAKIHHYEELVKRGQKIVIAHGGPLEVIEAERILKEADPVEIHLYAKTSSDAPEVNFDENLGTATIPATEREIDRTYDVPR